MSPALQADSLPTEPPGKPIILAYLHDTMLCEHLISIKHFMTKNVHDKDFPGNLPSNAGDKGLILIPGQETKIPHATGQLSPTLQQEKPELSRVHAPRLEKPANHNERPLCCNKRNPRALQQRPRLAKKKKKNF